MREIREAKKLKTQLRKLEEQIFDIHNIMAEYQRRYNGLKKERISLITKINDMKKGELKVTEHAMLRYFERVLGFNLEEIEAIIQIIINSYEGNHSDGSEFKSDTQWNELAIEMVSDEIPKFRRELELKFRSLLGVK